MASISEEDILDICHQQERKVLRTGYITSHKYPSDYHPNLECHCNVTTQTDQKMLITFSDFAVEWSENCLNDVLEIRVMTAYCIYQNVDILES